MRIRLPRICLSHIAHTKTVFFSLFWLFFLIISELHRLAHPKDDLTNEQRLAYINTVLRQAYPEIDKDKPVEERPYPIISWPVITEALFRRSLLEHTSVRRTERALNQLEVSTKIVLHKVCLNFVWRFDYTISPFCHALISFKQELSNQVDMNEPTAEKRSPEHFFFTRMPSSWSIQVSVIHSLTVLVPVTSPATDQLCSYC